jgi:hypothetical protein
MDASGQSRCLTLERNIDQFTTLMLSPAYVARHQCKQHNPDAANSVVFKLIWTTCYSSILEPLSTLDAIFLQVARLVPFLITSLERMQPYAHLPSAAAALEAAGPAAVPALMAVLAAGDPTDWPMLPHEVEGYKVRPKYGIIVLAVVVLWQSGGMQLIKALTDVMILAASTDFEMC